MKNITINIPDLYDENIKKLVDLKLIASRSEAVRTALREFLQKECDNLDLLGFFEYEEKKLIEEKERLEKIQRKQKKCKHKRMVWEECGTIKKLVCLNCNLIIKERGKKL